MPQPGKSSLMYITLTTAAAAVSLAIPLGVGGRWALEQHLDQRFASVSQLVRVEEEFHIAQDAIKRELDDRNAVRQDIYHAIEDLSIMVLDLRIQILAEEVRMMEQQKSNNGSWSQSHQRLLTERRQALQDLRAQRSHVFNRRLQATESPATN